VFQGQSLAESVGTPQTGGNGLDAVHFPS
jgi:hypothetical protein